MRQADRSATSSESQTVRKNSKRDGKRGTENLELVRLLHATWHCATWSVNIRKAGGCRTVEAINGVCQTPQLAWNALLPRNGTC